MRRASRTNTRNTNPTEAPEPTGCSCEPCSPRSTAARTAAPRKWRNARQMAMQGQQSNYSEAMVGGHRRTYALGRWDRCCCACSCLKHAHCGRALPSPWTSKLREGHKNKSSPRLDAFCAERTMRAREHCRRLRLAHADHTIQPGDRTDRRPANANANARRVIDRRKVTAGTV